MEQPHPPFPSLRAGSKELVAHPAYFCVTNKLFFKQQFSSSPVSKTISTDTKKYNLKLNILNICPPSQKIGHKKHVKNKKNTNFIRVGLEAESVAVKNFKKSNLLCTVYTVHNSCLIILYFNKLTYLSGDKTISG